MDRLVYILDTNAIADYMNQYEPTTSRIKQSIRNTLPVKRENWRE